MSDDVLVKVEGVSKKFCRSLKRSLWYGVQDVSAEMFGRKGSHDELRKNEFWAVNDVSFELKRGECLGLIGPNGAGKSTLLKMLNGLVKPDKGRITMRGRVGALIELGAGFNPILTARENIYVNGSVLGFTKKEISRKFDAIVDFAEIEEFIYTPVQNFSSGMKVRLGFAVAAQMEPDVLLIDEVLAVGDDMFRRRCYRRIESFQNDGKTILFVSHNMQSVSSICSRALLVHAGKSVLMGEPKEIVNHYHELIANLEDKKFRTQANLPADDYRRPSSEQKSSGLNELRFGNGGAEIQSVEILNERGEPTDVLTTGSEFTICIRVRFLRATKEPVIGFTIKTLRGVEVFGTSTQLLDSQVGPAKKGETLTVRFRQHTALGLDTYSLSAAVSEIEHGARCFQDRRLDVQTVRIIGNRRTFGLVDLNSEIAIEREFAKLNSPKTIIKSGFDC